MNSVGMSELSPANRQKKNNFWEKYNAVQHSQKKIFTTLRITITLYRQSLWSIVLLCTSAKQGKYQIPSYVILQYNTQYNIITLRNYSFIGILKFPIASQSQRNTSKFAIFDLQKKKTHAVFFISCNFEFYLMNALVYVDIDQGIYKVKQKVA